MKFRSIYTMAAVALGATAALSLTSCSDDKDPWNDFYGDPDASVKEIKEKPRFLWVDAAANFPDFADSKENIARDIALAKEAGFTHLVVDVRPTTGDVLFKTDLVDQATALYAWTENGHELITRTATWDYLQAFIDECRKQDMGIYAAMNTMVGGHASNGGTGLLYRDATKRDWATVLNLTSGLTNILDYPGEDTKFLNPANPEVQDFIVGLVSDLAKYDIDGIILDRCRYLEMTSDFSEYSRKGFEDFVGQKLGTFPDDVMPAGAQDIPQQTPYFYKQWWEYRASVIHNLMERCAAAVKGVNPDVKFGAYVGAWYNSYYRLGVNWASPQYVPTGSASAWATRTYRNWGYVDHLDILILGCYAGVNAVYGTNEWTMQGFARLGYQKTLGDCPMVIGGPDGGFSSGGTDLQKYNAVQNSVDACINECDGYFFFDMIHIKKSPTWWTAVKTGIDKYLEEYNALINPPVPDDDTEGEEGEDAEVA